MGSSAEKTVIRARPVPEPVSIVNWPLRDDRLWSLLLIATLIGIAGLCGSISGSLPLAMLSFIVLAIAAWRLWIPVTFTFTSRGVVETVFGRQRRISWPQIARYKVYPGGVLLLADPEPGPLESLRGVYIRWCGHREELLEFLRCFLDTQLAAHGSTRSYFSRDDARS